MAATVPVGAATTPLDPLEHYERTELRPERATSVDASGMVAWYDPGVGGQIGRAPRANWTRAGGWNLNTDTEWELDLPVVSGATSVNDPMPNDIDAFGNTVGTAKAQFTTFGIVSRPVRWDPTGTATVLDGIGAAGNQAVPVHVNGTLAAGTSADGTQSDAVRWNGTTGSILPAAPGTTECRVDTGEGDSVLGACWNVGGTPVLVRWNLVSSSVTELAVQPPGGPREVLDVASDLRLATTVSDLDGVDARNANGAPVRTIEPTWSTFDDGSGQIQISDATLMAGGDLLVTAGWWFGSCPCQAAVIGTDGTIRWIDPATSNSETSVRSVGALTDGTVIAVTSETQVVDLYAPYEQHRGTALYSSVARTPFPDVLPGHPFFSEIERGHELGYVRGYSDGTFRPGVTVSRQAFVAFLVRARTDRWGFATPPACTAAPFPDVGIDHPFCPEIALSKARGWVTGYSDGLFRPGNPITRQAVAAVTFRTNPSVPTPLPTECRAIFSDVGLDHPFCAAITWAFDNDVVNGYPDGTFRPGNNSSRQATVAILERALAKGDLPVAAGWYTDV